MVQLSEGRIKYISEKGKIPERIVRMTLTLNREYSSEKRQPKPQPPEGGISLREAARKYRIHHTTFSRWIKRGLLPVLQKTKNWTYVDENALRNLLKNGDSKRSTT